MGKSVWDHPGLSVPDPAWVQKEQIGPQHSERQLEAFRKRVAAANASKKQKPCPRVTLSEALKGKRELDLSISQRISVVKRSGKADASRFIHRTAVMILRHTEKSGNCLDAAKLVFAMHPSPRRERLIAWFERYSPIRISLKSQKAGFVQHDGKANYTFDIAMADRFPFDG